MSELYFNAGRESLNIQSVGAVGAKEKDVIITVFWQVLASVRNKIEHFASIEKDFPGLLLEAQQYLLFRVDMSDAAEELLTKGK